MPMPKLTYLLVTLPLMVLPATAFAVKPALASTAAEEAVRILSRAKAADRQCDILSSSERSELSRYTARAEVAAASQSSAVRRVPPPAPEPPKAREQAARQPRLPTSAKHSKPPARPWPSSAA